MAHGAPPLPEKAEVKNGLANPWKKKNITTTPHASRTQEIKKM
jgi:hypothetical protein